MRVCCMTITSSTRYSAGAPGSNGLSGVQAGDSLSNRRIFKRARPDISSREILDGQVLWKPREMFVIDADQEQ